jgi:hypothetical protein
MAPVEAIRLVHLLIVLVLLVAAAVLGGDDGATRLAIDELEQRDEEALQITHQAATSSSSARLRAPDLTALRNKNPAKIMTTNPMATTPMR